MKKAIIAIAFVVIFALAYNAGVNNTIKNAIPSIENECIVIDFNGQIHTYDK